jgi:hypothetical protein
MKRRACLKDQNVSGYSGQMRRIFIVYVSPERVSVAAMLPDVLLPCAGSGSEREGIQTIFRKLHSRKQPHIGQKDGKGTNP